MVRRTPSSRFHEPLLRYRRRQQSRLTATSPFRTTCPTPKSTRTARNAQESKSSRIRFPTTTSASPLEDDMYPVIRPRSGESSRRTSYLLYSSLTLSSTASSRTVHVCPIPSCGACFARREHVKRHVRGLHTDEKVSLGGSTSTGM